MYYLTYINKYGKCLRNIRYVFFNNFVFSYFFSLCDFLVKLSIVNNFSINEDPLRNLELRIKLGITTKR